MSRPRHVIKVIFPAKDDQTSYHRRRVGITANLPLSELPLSSTLVGLLSTVYHVATFPLGGIGVAAGSALRGNHGVPGSKAL
jgi:hypothetical protein